MPQFNWTKFIGEPVAMFLTTYGLVALNCDIHKLSMLINQNNRKKRKHLHYKYNTHF